MSEMVERVARAVCWGQGLNPNAPAQKTCACKSQDDCEVWGEFMYEARAAIAQWREPTEAMYEAWRSVNCTTGKDGMEEFTYFEGDYGNWVACHNAMIDNALSDES